MVYKSKALIDKATSYVGYLEKDSAKDLDNFTANAGDGNYTKFARDYMEYTGKKGLQPSYWCAEFVSCVVVEAFGLKAAKELMCGSLFCSCTEGRNNFRNKGQFHTEHPLPGDIIMYYNRDKSAIGHCGIVTKVSATHVYTVEGNTSAGSKSTVIDNGGCVAEKYYPLSYGRIAGYARMALDDVDPTEDANVGNGIYLFQKWLKEAAGQALATDGVYGKVTKRCALKALQSVLNAQYKGVLIVDGLWGEKTKKSVKNVEQGDSGDLVFILQGMLYCRGYDPKGFDGICGDNTVAAIKMFQSKNFPKREVDSICGPNTWEKLFA